jgi:hypothetical protein
LLAELVGPTGFFSGSSKAQELRPKTPIIIASIHVARMQAP